MAPRYVIRTVDEDWIDLFDAPAHVDDERAAWKRPSAAPAPTPSAPPASSTATPASTLWRSDPDLPPRFEVVAVNDTVFYALGDGPPSPG